VTNASSVDYTVTFSEDVTGVDDVTFVDFELNTSGITGRVNAKRFAKQLHG
jgi:hypothetical protein